MNKQVDRFQTECAYFIVTFADKALTIPIVQTLVFDSAGERTNGAKYFLFRELLSDGLEQNFIVDEDQSDDMVLDQAGLLEKLKDCFEGNLSFSPSSS